MLSSLCTTSLCIRHALYALKGRARPNSCGPRRPSALPLPRPPRATTPTQFSRATSTSTSANPYPFPKNAHPTPHQIFHLPKSATRADVKARYYDLVRIYHPDSPSARAGGVSPEAAHARFQAIASAYAVLSGKKPLSSLDGTDDAEGFSGTSRPSYHDLSTAMWRARQRKRAELDIGLDDRWKERMMMGAVLLAIALFVLQTYTTRAQALADGRNARRAASRPDSLAALGADEVQRLSSETGSSLSRPSAQDSQDPPPPGSGNS